MGVTASIGGTRLPKDRTYGEVNGFRQAKHTATPYGAEPSSSTGPRLGVFIGLAHRVSWQVPISLLKLYSLSGASPHQAKTRPYATVCG